MIVRPDGVEWVSLERPDNDRFGDSISDDYWKAINTVIAVIISDEIKNDHGCDILKKIIVIFIFLLAGLASAYTPEQQTTLEGLNLSFRLGIAYDKAIHGQNVAEYNALVDEYNAWIRQHFGEDASLLKSKWNEPTTAGTTSTVTSPFNASSELSKFGKQQVRRATPRLTQEDLSQRELNKFLTT
jgi:hypothetical protein